MKKCLSAVILSAMCTTCSYLSWPHGAIFNVNAHLIWFSYVYMRYCYYLNVCANKKCIMLIWFVLFKIKLAEMISVSVSVLFEHFNNTAITDNWSFWSIIVIWNLHTVWSLCSNILYTTTTVLWQISVITFTVCEANINVCMLIVRIDWSVIIMSCSSSCDS